MPYRGAGSDGGIEKALFDTPNVTSHTPDDIGSIIGQMILHEESIYDEEVKNTFLFPNLLHIPMVLHILCVGFWKQCVRKPLAGKNVRPICGQLCISFPVQTNGTCSLRLASQINQHG